MRGPRWRWLQHPVARSVRPYQDFIRSHGTDIQSRRALIPGVAESVHWQELSLPGPTTFNLKHQRPTQEGSYYHQPCEKPEARVSQFDRYGFHYVCSNQDFEP